MVVQMIRFLGMSNGKKHRGSFDCIMNVLSDHSMQYRIMSLSSPFDANATSPFIPTVMNSPSFVFGGFLSSVSICACGSYPLHCLHFWNRNVFLNAQYVHPKLHPLYAATFVFRLKYIFEFGSLLFGAIVLTLLHFVDLINTLFIVLYIYLVPCGV